MTPLTRISQIASHFGVELSDVCSASTLRGPLRARRVAVYVLRAKHGLTLGEICHALKLSRSSKPNIRRMYNWAASHPDPDLPLVMGPEGESQ